MEEKSVLILDDDVDILNLLRIEFKRIGYLVYEATTAKLAINIIDKELIDAAIIDIVLGPNETSDSLIQHLKEHSNPDVRTIPVIITSSHITPQFADKIESKWGNVYKAIAKPFRAGQVSALVSQMLLDIESNQFVIIDSKDLEAYDTLSENELSFKTTDNKITITDLDTTLVHKEQLDAQAKNNSENLAKEDVDFRNAEGETSLMIFSRKNDLQTVTNLVNLGANIDSTSPTGQTALHLAARHGHYNIVKLLLEKNAKLNIRDSESKEPLFEAICSGNYKTVDLLIGLGSRLDLKVEGFTYLMWAMDMNHPNIFNRLLAAWLEPKIKSKNGQTIKQIAKQKGFNDFLRILTSLGL